MKRQHFDKIRRVHFMPASSEIEEGVIYISEEYNISEHKCPCGCGEIVVMTLLPQVGWTYSIKEDRVSFNPSIGNYSFPCRSHYFIQDNKVRWCV